MQRYELDAWLGDDPGLDDEQIRALLAAADEIERRYPGPDGADDREAALTVAYRLMVEPAEDVVHDLREGLSLTRLAEARAKVGAVQAALILVRERGQGVESESGFADRVGVDRQTVRRWLGKPRWRG